MFKHIIYIIIRDLVFAESKGASNCNAYRVGYFGHCVTCCSVSFYFNKVICLNGRNVIMRLLNKRIDFKIIEENPNRLTIIKS
jgi:hypothetical protein